jgi:CSLREA domain-containing protein
MDSIIRALATFATATSIVGLLGPICADAAVFSVTKTADTADGACDADCSLREAILAANALAGPDEVVLPAGTYMLSLVAAGTGKLGTLVIADDGSAATTDDALTLHGAGAATTVIQQTLFAKGVIEIQNDVANVVIEDVTLRGGNGTDGAGIITFAPTTIRRVLMTDCHGNDDAGAIMSFATLEVADSVFEENTAIDDAGALMTFAQATVTRSTFHHNTAGNDAGAIMNFAELTVENCTFSDNEAGTAAPGTGTGGAIKSFDALTLTASTFTANRAGLAGGGLHTDVDVAQSVQLEGNIVAGNLPGDCGVQAGTPAIHSLGHNLDGDGSCLPTPATGDQTNPTPGLGPLADNGGPTMTHALLPGSPALDAWTVGCPGPDTDQRGAVRPQGTACDIGAYELGDLPVTTTTTITITTTTTTTNLPGCGPVVDFPSLLCHLEELLGSTADAGDLGSQKAGLVKNATRARELATDGQSKCADGSSKSRKKAGAQVRQVGRQLVGYERKLRSRKARKQLAESVRVFYLARVHTLLADVQTLRSALTCPDDA